MARKFLTITELTVCAKGTLSPCQIFQRKLWADKGIWSGAYQKLWQLPLRLSLGKTSITKRQKIFRQEGGDGSWRQRSTKICWMHFPLHPRRTLRPSLPRGVRFSFLPEKPSWDIKRSVESDRAIRQGQTGNWYISTVNGPSLVTTDLKMLPFHFL